MSLREWLVPAATGVAGLAAGFLLAGGSDAPGLAEPVPNGQAGWAQAPMSAQGQAASSAISLDDLRRVVRDELAARDGAAGRADSRIAASDPPATPPDAAQVAAASQASAMLNAAIARRTWTNGDSESAREEVAKMTTDQRVELLQQFAQAVNQGRLIPETDQVPF